MNDIKDIASRAGWTAAQAGLAVVVAAGSGWVDITVWRGAGIAAVAAGLSAIKTWTLSKTSQQA